MRRTLPLCALLAALGCASTPRRATTAAPGVDIARAPLAWAPWSREAFDRARAERRYVLIDGAAAWCHWCHVMDETTYADPAVQRAIAARFVAVRFDVDARPDLAARYAAYGWPATVILSPDGDELDARRGYLAPDRMLAALSGVEGRAPRPATSRAPAAVSFDALREAVPAVTARLDGFYDRARGSWGDWQKLSLGHNVLFELRRARRGDVAARDRAAFTLAQQRAIYDPVWGGVYQYSAGATWGDPHFEKLMTFQGPTVEALAAAFALTGDAAYRDDARAIERYLAEHLRSPEGAYHPAQDADVNAHDRAAPFVDGHDYYRLDDRGRRALGEPRVDPHVYARDNGVALAALAALDAVDPSPAREVGADRTADAMLEGHVTDAGAVRHEAGVDGPRFLADAASLGLGLARWSERARDPARAARDRAAAVAVADAMRRDFADEPMGLLRASAGADARPAGDDGALDDNVTAARLLLWRADVTPDAPAAWSARAHALGILRRLVTPEALARLGRMLGELLCALDEAGLTPSADATRDTRWTDGAAATAALTRGPDGATLRVELNVVEPFHLSRDYPLSLSLRDGATPASRLARRDATVTATGAAFVAPLREGGAVDVELRYARCTDAVCLPESLRLRVARAP